MSNFITDLDQIKQLAALHHDDFEVMCYMLEADDDLNDAALDAFVEALAAPIISGIDCTLCANCCRSLDVHLTQTDLECIADTVQIPVSAVMTRYAEPNGEGGQIFRPRPCPFLVNNLCTIYTNRPDACRIYPAFTPDFRWTLADTIAGASYCPITCNVLMALHERIDDIIRSGPDLCDGANV